MHWHFGNGKSGISVNVDLYACMYSMRNKATKLDRAIACSHKNATGSYVVGLLDSGKNMNLYKN